MALHGVLYRVEEAADAGRDLSTLAFALLAVWAAFHGSARIRLLRGGLALLSTVPILTATGGADGDFVFWLLVSVALYASLLEESGGISITALAVSIQVGLLLSAPVVRPAVGLGRAVLLAMAGGFISILRARWRGSMDALAQTDARFRAMAEASPAGIFFYDAEANVQYANPAGIAMVGLPKSELLGRGWERAIHPDDLARLRADLAETLASGEGYAGSGRFVQPDGRIVWWEAMAAAVEPGLGGEGGFVSVLRDVSEERALSAALERQHSLLLEAERLAETGSWSFDPVTAEREWSANMFALFGVPPDEPPPSEALLASLDEEDRQRIIAALSAAPGSALAGEPFATEFEFQVARGGSPRWMHGRARVSVSGDRPMLLGTIQDVTSRRLMEEAIRQSQAMLQSVLDNSPARIVIKTIDGRLLYLNEAQLDAMGMPAEQLLGRRPEEFLPAEVAEEIRRDDETVLRSGEPMRSQQSAVVRGIPVMLNVLRFPIRDQEGAITGLCTVMNDVTQEVTEREIRGRERRQIAADLHDDAVQVMAAVALHLDGLDVSGAGEERQEEVAALSSAVRSAVVRLRGVMSDLVDDTLETQGLGEALQRLVREWEPRSSSTFSLDVSGYEQEVALPVRTALLHVAREAVANGVKHSGGTKIDIVLERSGDRVHLTVADDGSGFAFGEGSPPGHFGLSAMRDIVNQVGGTITLGPARPQGTLVEAHAPVVALNPPDMAVA
ncbi:MAG: PAS domain S-box protein [Actinomycetota bacterium]